MENRQSPRGLAIESESATGHGSNSGPCRFLFRGCARRNRIGPIETIPLRTCTIDPDVFRVSPIHFFPAGIYRTLPEQILPFFFLTIPSADRYYECSIVRVEFNRHKCTKTRCRVRRGFSSVSGNRRPGHEGVVLRPFFLFESILFNQHRLGLRRGFGIHGPGRPIRTTAEASVL